MFQHIGSFGPAMSQVTACTAHHPIGQCLLNFSNLISFATIVVVLSFVNEHFNVVLHTLLYLCSFFLRIKYLTESSTVYSTQIVLYPLVSS